MDNWLAEAIAGNARFKLGDRVTKIKGSSWTGHVVGFYSTSLTPRGYNVESEKERGSVQLYPEAALVSMPPAITIRLAPEGEGLISPNGGQTNEA